MGYKEQLRKISESIYHLDLKVDSEVSALFQSEGLARFDVYQRHLLQGALEHLSEDFLATQNYLGEKNFRFFCRQYLLDEGFTSENRVDLSQSFPEYLGRQIEVHQDDWISLIAGIDLLWSHGQVGQKIYLPRGLTALWQNLQKGQLEDQEFSVDDIEKEQILVDEVDGEKVFRLLNLESE